MLQIKVPPVQQIHYKLITVYWNSNKVGTKKTSFFFSFSVVPENENKKN